MLILNASLINFTTILLYVNDIYKFDIKKIIIKNGELILYIKDYRINNHTVYIELKSEIDIKRLTYLIYDDTSINVNYISLYSSQEFDDKYYTDLTPGVYYTKEYSDFYLWSPVASYVNLLIYENGDSSISEKPRKFKMVESHGLWSTKIKGNLKGYFYNFELKIYDSINECVDPYVKAVGINGNRGAVIDLSDTNPKNFNSDSSPQLQNPTDAVIYEISIRDISVHPDSNITNKGKYSGLVEERTFSRKGVSTGLQHIKDLGITHIQLMPIFDFSDSSVDERHPYKYNWGYNPHNYNVPEGSYSTDPFYPLCRIYELKKMIFKLHKNGLGVIMDVVYNHVFNYTKHSFHKVFPGYYFRSDNTGTLSNGSGCGNDIASERSMVRKYIMDSVLYWAKEYHIDGFRFDLMGLLDIGTMKEIKNKLHMLNRNILLYGEGWSLNTFLPEDKKASMKNSHKLPGIAHFNDIIRDSIKGSVFNEHDRGFVSGKSEMVNNIKYCVTGCTFSIHGNKPLFSSPSESINFASCHDNYTLWDKLQISCPDCSEEDLKAMHILADGIILTSQGIPFIHGGAEFCRTKNGIENSYNCTDNINRMDWNRKNKFKDVFQYYTGLIKLRKEHSAFKITELSILVKQLLFIRNTPANSVAFILSDNANGDTWKNIIVIYNANKSYINISIPYDHWNLVVNRKNAGTDILRSFTGNSIDVEPISITVLYSN